MPEVRKPIHRMIAAAMAKEINADSILGPIIRAEHVANPKRRLEELREGETIVDFIGQGARSVPRNRRHWDMTYIVWVAVHMKLRDGEVTDGALDEAGYLSQEVQEFFLQPDKNEVRIESGQRVVLSAAEPYPLAREPLSFGLHLSTYSFEWSMVR